MTMTTELTLTNGTTERTLTGVWLQSVRWRKLPLTNITLSSRNVHVVFDMTRVQKRLTWHITTIRPVIAVMSLLRRHTITDELPNAITVNSVNINWFRVIAAKKPTCGVRCTQVTVTVGICSWNFIFNIHFLYVLDTMLTFWTKQLQNAYFSTVIMPTEVINNNAHTVLVFSVH